jgi:NADH:ubiquinone oxidoreductase subunit H
MTEYSAFIFVAFFLYEYCGLVLLSCLTSILFLGGYNIPYIFIPLLNIIDPFNLISFESISLAIKTCFLICSVV